MKSLILKLIDLAEWPFAIPHDWPWVRWIVHKLTPKSIWEDYGNPLCYAYCFSISHWFFRLYSWVGNK